MKNRAARSTGSSREASAAASHSASENGVACTTRRKARNVSSPWSTRQKLVRSPLMSFTTSDTPAGSLARRTARLPAAGLQVGAGLLGGPPAFGRGRQVGDGVGGGLGG